MILYGAATSLQARLRSVARAAWRAVHPWLTQKRRVEVNRRATDSLGSNSTAACFGRWAYDPASRRLVWSRDMARLFEHPCLPEGYSDLDPILESLGPETGPAMRAFLVRAVAGDIVGADDYFCERFAVGSFGGTTRTVAVHGQRRHKPGGTCSSLTGIAVDITEIVRAQRLACDEAALMRETIETMDQGLINLDSDLRVRLFNKRTNALFGVPNDVLFVGTSMARIRDFLAGRGDYGDQPDRLTPWIESAGRPVVPDFYERIAPDGTALDIRRTRLADGGFVMTFTDATLRKRAEADLQDSERRFRLLAENANDVIILSDLTFKRLYVSPAIRNMLGYEPEVFKAMSVEASIHPDDRATFELLSRTFNNESAENFVTTARYLHKGGGWIWCEVSVRLVRDRAGDSPNRYVLALRDVTARRQAEEKARHLAMHDALTGLPNRALFRNRLDEAIKGASRSRGLCAVLACDLDRFKAVNDTLGHPAGDALLRIITARMASSLRPGDMLARLGGDEFAIVLDDIASQTEAFTIAERLIEAVGEPMAIDGDQLGIGVSIGIAIVSGSVGADELFKQADIALYQAKGAGRNTCRLYEQGAHKIVATRGQLALDMSESLRRGHFRLVYQPIIELATGRISNFEALMRWRHPVRGDIPPSDFIPVAEESGIIVALGTWALREACREASRWPSDIRVAVNVSAVQFRRKGLEECVISALGQYGLPPDRLKLEVTESVLLEDSDAVLAGLRRLQALGVRIALDDFGTGYSSLSYLRRFPFDKIKIDGSFVREIADPDAAAIVRAIVSIGERLGMSITAKGVETKDQLERVRQEGCTEVQGFYFSRPLEAKDALAYALKAKAIAA